MKAEKQKLLDDLWGTAPSRREATLRAGSAVLRRRRHIRLALRSSAIISVLLVLAGVYYRSLMHPARIANQIAAAKSSEHPQIGTLNNDQLLAVFADAPVGIVKLKDGRQRLVFFRPEDEARYVTRF